MQPWWSVSLRGPEEPSPDWLFWGPSPVGVLWVFHCVPFFWSASLHGIIWSLLLHCPRGALDCTAQVFLEPFTTPPQRSTSSWHLSLWSSSWHHPGLLGARHHATWLILEPFVVLPKSSLRPSPHCPRGALHCATPEEPIIVVCIVWYVSCSVFYCVVFCIVLLYCIV